MRYLKAIMLLWMVPGLWVSCTSPGAEDLEPAYLDIASFKVTDTTSGSELPAGEQMVDAVWVSVNGKFHGAFTLPARIPLLEEGKTRLRLQPGVIVNGIKATRSIFPFLRDTVWEPDLIKGGEVAIRPVSSYFQDLSFRVNEDFESPATAIQPSSGNTAGFERASEPGWSYMDSWSGKALLDTGHKAMELVSDRWLALPVGKPVWLELQYRNDQEFFIGMIIEQPGQTLNAFKVGLNPQSSWKKLYVNLSEFTQTQFTGTRYKLIFKADFKGADTVKHFIGLDQIRLVHE